MPKNEIDVAKDVESLPAELSAAILARIRNKIPIYPNEAIQPLVNCIACYLDWHALSISKDNVEGVLRMLPANTDIGTQEGLAHVNMEVQIESLRTKILKFEYRIGLLEKLWKIAMFLGVESIDILGLATKQLVVSTAYRSNERAGQTFGAIFDWSLVGTNIMVGVLAILLSFPIREDKAKIKALLKDANRLGAGERPFFMVRKHRYTSNAGRSYFSIFSPTNRSREDSPMLDPTSPVKRYDDSPQAQVN